MKIRITIYDDEGTSRELYWPNVEDIQEDSSYPGRFKIDFSYRPAQIKDGW